MLLSAPRASQSAASDREGERGGLRALHALLGPFWGLCRREFEAPLDPLEPDTLFVEALMDHRDVGLNIR